MSSPTLLICPYCGSAQRPGDRCAGCGGHFDSLSRRASHNEMGPWFIRTDDRAFQPGCSYETMVRLIERNQLTKISVVRGPTTRQFWTIARRVPGLAHLLGYCHDCDGRVDPEDHHCPACSVAFGAYLDRDWLGLPGVRPLGGDVPEADEADPEIAWSEGHDRPSAPGLSSFARDDELMSTSAAAVAMAEAVQAAPASTLGGGSEEVMASPVVRALQQKVVQQERVARVLVVLLIVSMLGGVLFNLNTRGRFGDLPVEDQAAGGTAADVLATPEMETAAIEAAAVEGEAVVEGEAAPATSARGESAEEPEPAAAPAVDLEMVRARTLVAESEAASSDAVRLARLRAALRSLESADARLHGDHRPADLDDMLGETRGAIEVLELRAYFGGDGDTER